jgi:hypothetical protein
MKSLIVPQVNLNGTDARSLVEQTMKVVRTLRAAAEDCRQAWPHGRDYPNSLIDGENGVYKAQDAWRERVVAISRIADDFEQVAVAVSMQASARRAG